MASLSHSLYDMPGLAPRMDVLFWGRHDFQISFSNRDTSRYAWNRYRRSFMVDTGTLSNNMKFLSHECLRHYIAWPNKWQPSTDQTLYQLDFYWIMRGSHGTTGDAYSSGHLVPSHLGLAYVLLVETNPNLSLFFRTMLFEHPSVLSRFCLTYLWFWRFFLDGSPLQTRQCVHPSYVQWYECRLAKYIRLRWAVRWHERQGFPLSTCSWQDASKILYREYLQHPSPSLLQQPYCRPVSQIRCV